MKGSGFYLLVKILIFVEDFLCVEDRVCLWKYNDDGERYYFSFWGVYSWVR